MKPVEIGNSGKKIAKAFNKLGWHWWPSYSAISTEKKNGRSKNSRSEVNITYWPKAISNGVELRPNCRVKNITLGKNGKANGVIYFDKKNQKKFQKAKFSYYRIS